MNRFFLLFFSLLLLRNGITRGQSFEITVLNKNSQPMPYAYILVNNKPVEVSDTMGIAIIPLNKLAINDTISVSYLGASPAWIIYDGSLKENKKHSFHLDESGYNLNEVVVTYQDIEKQFRKSIKSVPVLNYNCKMTAKFDASLKFDPNLNNIDKKFYSFSGTIEAVNDLSFKQRYWNWFDPPVKFNTNSDTTRMSRSLNYHTHRALNDCNISLWRFQNEKKYKGKPIYSYLGEKDNNKVFRISYPKTWFAGFYYQILFYVDKDSKYINSVEIDAFNDEPDANNDLTKFSIKYDCELFTQSKPKMNTIYLPNNVYYRLQLINKTQFDLKISDISIKGQKF